jgi:hypothetical protein
MTVNMVTKSNSKLHAQLTYSSEASENRTQYDKILFIQNDLNHAMPVTCFVLCYISSACLFQAEGKLQINMLTIRLTLITFEFRFVTVVH